MLKTITNTHKPRVSGTERKFCSLASLNLRSEGYIEYFRSFMSTLLLGRAGKDDEVAGRSLQRSKHWILSGTRTVTSAKYK